MITPERRKEIAHSLAEFGERFSVEMPLLQASLLTLSGAVENASERDCAWLLRMYSRSCLYVPNKEPTP